MTTQTLKTNLFDEAVNIVESKLNVESEIITDARNACNRIAPVWPLRHFVAVNPYVGLSEFHFIQAAQVLGHANGAKTVAAPEIIAKAILEGDIADIDLQSAIDNAPALRALTVTTDLLKTHAKTTEPTVYRWTNVTDIANEVTDFDWCKFAVDQTSRWCSAYFDQGQAFWSLPEKQDSIFSAWLKYARNDRTPTFLGLKGYRQALLSVDIDPMHVLKQAELELEIPETSREAYFYRCLSSISGWAAFARYKGWDAELSEEQDDTLIGLLAIRVAIDIATFRCMKHNAEFLEHWQKTLVDYQKHGVGKISKEVYLNCLLQSAYDFSEQRKLLQSFNLAPKAPSPIRKEVQAVFCIDVRSEVYRRALEKVNNSIETFGFAGFFGFPIEYVPIGQEAGGSQCPVLLKPQYVIRETLKSSNEEEHDEVMGLRILRRRAAKAWKTFKQSAVSSFAFVETIGLAYVVKLITDGFSITRTVPHPREDGLSEDSALRRKPDVNEGFVAERKSGIDLEQRITIAENALKAMSIKAPYARLIMFVGHGSTTVNNPHASGFDCGACGGHTGEANARVAAAVMNDPQVRIGLAKRGMDIPADTLFLAGLHDTTTDELVIYDKEDISDDYQDDLVKLEESIKQAGELSRKERSQHFNLSKDDDVDQLIINRSQDWSEVRPELGLAGCSAFVVAPRYRTASLSFGGKSFLHSYDWKHDKDFKILELIMTAPMVVTSWINLQYFGSTVDNKNFGSGNKTLHNVVGQMGVLEGNSGDLRVGLPMQSISNGDKLLHKPLRLAVLIEAPTEAIDSVIAKHPSIKALLDNEWIYLYAINNNGIADQRYSGNLTWQTIDIEQAA